MTQPEKITLRVILVQLNLAIVSLDAGDVLRARERLALVVKELDAVCYPANA